MPVTDVSRAAPAARGSTGGRGRGWWAGRTAASVGVLLLFAGLATEAVRGGHPRQASARLTDGTAWLVSNPTHELSRVNGVSATAEAVRPLPRARTFRLVPAAGTDDVLAVDSTAGTLVRLDPSLLTLATGQVASQRTDPGLLLDGSARLYLVVLATGMVRRLDPVALHPVGADLHLGGPLLDAVVAPDGSLWVSAAKTGAVSRIGPNGDVDRVTPGDGTPVTLGISHGTVTAVYAGTGRLTALPATGPGLSWDAPQLRGLAAPPRPATGDLGTKVAMLAADGTLYLADVRSRVVTALRLPADAGSLGRPVAAGGRVYVPDNANGTVLVADASTGRLVSPVQIPGATALEVFARDGMLWINDPDGPNAVVVYDGQVRPIVKYRATPAAVTGQQVPLSGSVIVDQGKPGDAPDVAGVGIPQAQPSVAPLPPSSAPGPSAPSSATPSAASTGRTGPSPAVRPSASPLSGDVSAGSIPGTPAQRSTGIAAAGTGGSPKPGVGTGATSTPGPGVGGAAGRQSTGPPGGAEDAPASAVGPTVTITLRANVVEVAVNAASSSYPFTSYALSAERADYTMQPTSAASVGYHRLGPSTFAVDLPDCAAGVLFQVVGRDQTGEETELYALGARGCLNADQSFTTTPGNGEADVAWRNFADPDGTVTIQSGHDGPRGRRTLPASVTSTHLDGEYFGGRFSYVGIGPEYLPSDVLGAWPAVSIFVGPLWRACRVRDFYCTIAEDGESRPIPVLAAPYGASTGVSLPAPPSVGFGVPVQLVCQAPSPEEYQTTILWDKIIYKGLTGYINDYNLNTPSRVQISGRPFGGVWAGFGGVPVCP